MGTDFKEMTRNIYSMLNVKYLSMASTKHEYPDLLPEFNVEKISFYTMFRQRGVSLVVKDLDFKDEITDSNSLFDYQLKGHTQFGQESFLNNRLSRELGS